jgi:hypothetical protein
MVKIDNPSVKVNCWDASWPSPERLIFAGSIVDAAFAKHGIICSANNTIIAINLIESLLITM